ncbi:MAG: hypothetical protein OXC44_00350 [Proteobacteria bacterium]|nr:hypothetical protein [Pseudomonadota bacterium]
MRFFENYANKEGEGTQPSLPHHKDLIEVFQRDIRKIFASTTNIRSLVLGCTHFAFAVSDIQKALSHIPAHSYEILDSSIIRAKECATWLTHHGLTQYTPGLTTRIYIHSGYNADKRKAIKNYLKTHTADVTFLDL